ncbi:12858_t:CDS:1, partial [Gigaspora rosea]
TETAELEGREASDPTKTNQDRYADLEPAEADTSEEEAEWWSDELTEKEVKEEKKEVEVFTVLIGDEDNDKTVQEEEDLTNQTHN